MMASGGSTCVSPGGAATAHRRRVADLIPEAERTTTDQGGGEGDSSSSSSKYSIAVAYVFFDDMIIKLLKSRKNMGRTIFGFLIMMLVVSMFLKFSLIDDDSDINTGARRFNKFFILNTLPKPSHQTQLIMPAQHQHLSSMPKRVLEKYPVSF